MQETLPDVAAVNGRRLFQILGQSLIPCFQQVGAERSDQTRKYQTHGGVQPAELCDHGVLRDDEDLGRDHHLDQHQGEEEGLPGELQTPESITGHGCCQAGEDHTEEDHQQGVFIQNEEVVAFPDRTKIFPMPAVGREDIKRIDRDRFLVGLECSQDHPREGDEHDKSHDAQDKIHDELVESGLCACAFHIFSLLPLSYRIPSSFQASA